jgi:tripartite-type tricarboxylate transporter receptor subunit TctC
MKNTFLMGGLLGFVVLACSAAQPQDLTYPNRPIRLVVPFTPGGGSDVIGRVLARKMSENMKQTIVVENKPGAGGSIGTQDVAKAAPDGYSLLIATSSTHGINPFLYSTLPYDAVKDFTPISMLATTDYAMAVGKHVKATSLPDLLNLAKTEKLNYASSGNGTTSHLAAAMLGTTTKSEFIHVPYKGSGPAFQDLLGGQVAFMFDNTSVIAPHIKGGKITVMATTGAKRSPVTPDVPTMVEMGMPEFQIIGWWAIMAPANTPKPIIDRLNKEVVQAINEPEVKARLSRLGNEPLTTTPEETRTYIAAELEKFKKIVHDTGAKLE